MIKQHQSRHQNMTETSNKPNFATWKQETLAQFADDCYSSLLSEKAANQQLRLDLKDAMRIARQQLLEHNASHHDQKTK